MVSLIAETQQMTWPVATVFIVQAVCTVFILWRLFGNR